MATYAMMIGGAITNALAFTGSSFLFSKLGSNDAQRHNAAMEKLSTDRDLWNQQRLKNIDYANKKLKEEANSKRQFRNVDDAMREYYRLTGKTLFTNQMGPEPQLEDYLDNEQLDAMQKRELTIIAAGLLASGFVAYKYL